MKIRQVVGAALVASPFIGIALLAHHDGMPWLVVLAIYGIVGVILIVVGVGVTLLGK
jgi:hypothetical protein